MNKPKDTQPSLSAEELSAVHLKDSLKDLAAALKQSNRHASKRNRLAEMQHQQSVLNYEQEQRRYLIEKSNLQPTFRLSVTEFLTCEPDFVNDPEQASEAKFLSDFGVGVDQRALRIKVHVKGDVPYMRPSIVLAKHAQGKVKDEQIYSMSELIYFVDVASMALTEENGSTDAYFVYRDKTTLPVLHKYRLAPRKNSALLRWDATHLDTLFASSHKDLEATKTSAGCAALFSAREAED